MSDKKNNAKEPLPQMTCLSTKCEEDKHCFRPSSRTKPENLTGGNCHACNVDKVDWKVVHKRDIADYETTFSFLKLELIRSVFWEEPIDAEMKDKILKKGLQKVTDSVGKRLKSSIYKSGRELFRDGTQTPIDTHNIVYWAQHASATCCRKCIKYWHNIPYDRDLTDEEFKYLQALTLKYIELRVPELNNTPNLLSKENSNG